MLLKNQLKTKSKMFCGCDNNAEGRAPNTVVCPVCMGFPGVLPVANRQAILWTIKTALALNCQIASFSQFDRKHYFYPDLPKNYQISQYDLPLAFGGNFQGVRIRRIHLEEDAGKLIHQEGEYSLVDFNRAGTPLMEIVTEPDITSPEEAKLFLQKLRVVLRYLQVSDADMEKGHLRCDSNISISAKGKGLGVPVEIKNLNSFKMVEKALAYEEKRQRELLEKGEKIEKETRGWSDKKGKTLSQRSKEESYDYRYFPEPDLPPFYFSQKEIEQIRQELPELPDQRFKRFLTQYHLQEKDAKILVENYQIADYFEEVVSHKVPPQQAAHWILGPLLYYLGKENLDITQNRILPLEMAKLIQKIEKNTLSHSLAKEIFQKMLETGKSIDKIIKEKSPRLINDEKQIEKLVEKVVKNYPKAIADYQKGKEGVLQFLVGQVMRETKGQAAPSLVQKIIRRKLNALTTD